MRCATPNSCQKATQLPEAGITQRRPRAEAGTPVRVLFCGLAACVGLFSAAPRLKGVQGEQSAGFLEAFRRAQARQQEKPADEQSEWQFGRTCFDLGDYATNSSERAQIAEQGITACRKALGQNPNSAPAHYYLGLNLGQLARTRTLGALKLVDQMESEFSRAIELDPNFDYGGPDRSIGLLYRDAPTFASIGSRSKARQHLQRALQLAPQYPENRLNLLESDVQWGDRIGGSRELKALEESLPKARADFAGPAWKTSWSDWETRLSQARKKLQDGSRLETPRH